MAGIAGTISEDQNTLNAILTNIKHRGPDGIKKKSHEGINIASCELLMKGDPKEGAHFAEEGAITVALDGRIYNKEKTGMTDAQAVISFYKKYGTHFASKLDGDFACAISDNGSLILARDWAGIKPLYYGHHNDVLCFSSEAKGLIGLCNDAREFPPGYVYSKDLGFQKFTIESVTVPEFENYEQGKKVTAQLLMEATEKRIKDKSIEGILLSGGLDSSLICYMACEIKPDIEAFTVSMEGAQDLPLAKDVTKYLGIKHHILMFGEEEIKEILPQAIFHQEMYEESCVHGAIANFLAGRFVKPFTNCVLTGEGADELFGGYDGQYKKGQNQEEVASIIDFLVNVAHNTALQRLDRLNAANGIESRTPFLDTAVIKFSQKIPIRYKVHGEEQTGKWIVRQAFEGCLPDHLIYQTKRFFAQGSGVASIMRNVAAQYITEQELAAHNSNISNPWLSSVEELYYYRMLKQTFPDPVFDRLVGRWDPLRPDFFRRQAGA